MNAEEIKRRNIALATYMGWRRIEYGAEYRYMHPGGGAVTDNPPFHEDMILLMPVVWRLMGERRMRFVIDYKNVYVMDADGMNMPRKLVPVVDSPELALFEAVSSLVMEIQEQQK